MCVLQFEVPLIIWNGTFYPCVVGWQIVEYYFYERKRNIKPKHRRRFLSLEVGKLAWADLTMTPSPCWLLINPSSMRFVIIIFTPPCPPTQMPTNQTRPAYISLAQRDKNALTILQLTAPISCVLEICLNILGPASIHHCESLVIILLPESTCVVFRVSMRQFSKSID